MSVTAYMNDCRRRQGLLTLDEILALAERGNVIYDPHSLLVSRRAIIGRHNVFFPNVTLFCGETQNLSIGDRNIFHAMTLMDAADGPIAVGSDNQFGEGGLTVRCNRPGAAVEIGDGGRYMGGASVFGRTALGSGSQLLGQIAVDSCRLEAGDSFRSPDPDARAGLLKGWGSARGLSVPRGSVIAGNGRFDAAGLERQSAYHPKA